MMEKRILDACCGSRMMWFDKQNPDTDFVDIRREKHVLCDGRVLEIDPDIQADFTDLPMPDGTYHLVVFDPPHLRKAGAVSWLRAKYGVLPDNWRGFILDGFNECWRVLKPNGTLVFKWNEDQVKVSEILKLLTVKPLFGHTTGRHGKTHWMTFLK